MEKRTLIALALSFLVLGFYPVVLKKIYPDYMKEKPKVSATAKADSSALPVKGAITAFPRSPLESAGNIPYKNDKLRLIFNSITGSIHHVEFLKYAGHGKNQFLEILPPKEIPVVPTWVELSGASQVPYYDFQKVGQENFNFVGSSEKIKITKKYEFASSGYSATLKIRFENISKETQPLDYVLYAGPNFEPRNSIDMQYIESDFYSHKDGKEEIRHIKESKLDKKITSAGSVEWVAAKDRHFSIILKPVGADNFTAVHEGLGKHHFRAGLVSPKTILPAGGSVEQEFLLYIGPNELEELLPLGLDPIVNFGKLDMIGKLLVGALEMLHKGTRNYGLAIIALTALINLILFPLTRQGYMSMKRMQLIQPQMTKLREQHKKNPEKLNREMMELYKKHKVNPFGGCLPMLLQMPVFIALYVALSKSVILINAKLFWIKDLSSPDSVGLPFTLPVLGNEIHVLPLIMVAAMAIQQKLMQVKMEGQDPAMESQQKMMATMMPIIFGFIFYKMPSGLVLYWLTNTLLMTAYQIHLKKVTLTT